MKKVTSILAVAVMALGMATVVIENTTSEFDFMDDNTKVSTCDDCDAMLDDKRPPKTIV